MRVDAFDDTRDLSNMANTSQDAGKQLGIRNTIFRKTVVLWDIVLVKQEVRELGLEILVVEHLVGDLDGPLRI